MSSSIELEKLVIVGEVKEIVLDYSSHKALGPDGFNFAFVKKYWEILKDDIHDFVKDVFHKLRIPLGCNSTFITLTPS